MIFKFLLFSLIELFKWIFWTGPICSHCKRILKPVERPYVIVKDVFSCTVYQCTNCGKLICKSCHESRSGATGLCKCGGNHFNVFQMRTN